MSLQLTNVTGAELAPIIHEIATLRIRVFAEYPYLYEGSCESEADYLKTYSKQATSLCVLAHDEDNIIGASTAMWIKHADPSFKKVFEATEWPIEDMFYLGAPLNIAFGLWLSGIIFSKARDAGGLVARRSSATQLKKIPECPEGRCLSGTTAVLLCS